MPPRSPSSSCSSCSASPSSTCESPAAWRARHDARARSRPRRARAGRARALAGPGRPHPLRHAALRVGVPRLFQDTGRALRDAHRLFARLAQRGELRRGVDVQAHALQPLLRQQPLGLVGDHGGDHARLHPGRLCPGPLPVRRAPDLPPDLPGDPDVSRRPPHRPPPLAVVCPRADRHLPGIDLLQLLFHGALHRLDARGVL